MASAKTDQLILDNKDNIAEKLRELQRLVKAFSGEIRTSAKPQQGEVKVSPITVYEPSTAAVDENPKKTRITRFKAMNTAASRVTAAEAFGKIEYEVTDPVNRSIQCYGVIGVPVRLILDANRINQAKDALKEAFEPVRKHQVRIPPETRPDGTIINKLDLSHFILRQLQESSLNLQAAYRKIPLVDEAIREMRFMLIRTRTVDNRTVESLHKELSKNPGVKGAKDLDRLRNLPPNELLARPTDRYERVRARVLLQRTKVIPKRPNMKVPERVDLPAELPVLFPVYPASVPPEIIAPTPWEPLTDSEFVPPPRLEEKPLLETWPYYRLRPEYRRYLGKDGKKKRLPPETVLAQS